MRNRLAEQIGSDPLTACANRRTLEKRLLADWRFARRRASCVAVTAIDIDHFKQINDTRGHPVGDLVLQQLASIMMSTARDTDTVARLGGDEFVIVLPDTDWHGATTFAERLVAPRDGIHLWRAGRAVGHHDLHRRCHRRRRGLHYAGNAARRRRPIAVSRQNRRDGTECRPDDDNSNSISLDDIRAAARALAPVAVRTPLLPVHALSWERFGVPVWVKPEMLQRGGAFKLRGAYNSSFARLMPPRIACRAALWRRRLEITPKPVALAARLFGVPATVVMPTTVTAAKRGGAERLGARVVLAGTTTADRMAKAQEIVHAENSTLVPPYDDVLIIAGQGTAGLEITEDLPDVGTVLVPVGGEGA